MSVIAVIGGTGVYDPSMFDNLEEKSMNMHKLKAI